MGQQGWIKLHRSILENELWREKREFSRAEAWIDLLLAVNHEDRTVIINGQAVLVRMGNKVTSVSMLAERWNWSRKKVTNFLKLLQGQNMISYKSTTKYTMIEVLKWGFYQQEGITEEQQKNNKSTSEEQQKSIKGTSEEQQKNTNKNVENDKNVKNEKKKDICACFESLWELYPVKKGKGNVSDTQKGKLYAIGYDEMKRAIERYSRDNANTELQYWKHGSTFFNSGYVDYLDANYTPPEPRPASKPKAQAAVNNFEHKQRDFSYLEE